MKFTWDCWDFDLDGEAYIIAKRECPIKEDVPDYIVREDRLHADCREDMVVQEGWCKFQVRSDWIDHEGEPSGWYCVSIGSECPSKKRQGWFPVWIVRKDEWY